jgi:hypothetical protein
MPKTEQQQFTRLLLIKIVALLVLLLIFIAYLKPDMMVDVANAILLMCS